MFRDPWLQVLRAYRDPLLSLAHLIAGSTLAAGAQDFSASSGARYPSDPVQHASPEHGNCPHFSPMACFWSRPRLCPRAKGTERKGPRELTGHLRKCSGRVAGITKERGIPLSCSIFFPCPRCTLALQQPECAPYSKATKEQGPEVSKREMQPPSQPALGPVSKADTFFPSIPSYKANSGLRIGPPLPGELDETTHSLQLPAQRGCGQRNRNTSLWLFPPSFLADWPQFT